MNVDEFWALVERSATAGPSRDAREDFLTRRLTRAPRAELLDWVQRLAATREPANTYRLWRAAEIIMYGWCSTDSFHYFQMWLVGLGRAAYDAAIADPDSLAGVPAVQRLAGLAWDDWEDADFPEWETLEYVAVDIGEDREDVADDARTVLEDERGVRVRYDPSPDDLEWRDLETADLAGRYPRLWALFGAGWRG
ncbi:DUF4240 domain-containing protein [Dactylosporangium darangshiense]|uniref:DUF4240 domain-containing protein n=1 Tax=Dactylosporangium darangshiense TaxID=579108 RepID=A0ABP8DCJ7_9ACTN